MSRITCARCTRTFERDPGAPEIELTYALLVLIITRAHKTIRVFDLCALVIYIALLCLQSPDICVYVYTVVLKELRIVHYVYTVIYRKLKIE